MCSQVSSVLRTGTCYVRQPTYLAVQVEQIKREQVNLDLDVFDLDVLALARAQLLELEQALLLGVPRDGFGVNDERLGSFLDALCVTRRRPQLGQ